MQIPLQISSRNLSLSEAAEQNIREKAEKLEEFYERITSCRIHVEAPHRHSHQGVLYNVRLDITVPGKELVVKREPNEDLYVAIRDAFNAAVRQLKGYARKRRGEIKAHEETPHGYIARLFHDEGYGFIQTNDGRDIYFHRNSVRNGGFDELAENAAVRYVEESGEDGPQASAVIPA